MLITPISNSSMQLIMQGLTQPIRFNKINVTQKTKNNNLFNFSTSFIKNSQIYHPMDNFQKTLNLLNALIQRLEANTGGEVKPDQLTKEQLK